MRVVGANEAVMWVLLHLNASKKSVFGASESVPQ